MTVLQQLDHGGIAARIPHSGTMCLLDRLESWSAEGLVCSATSHADPAHPLRSRSGLLAACAIEYAAQAMALHGALLAPAEGGPTPGFLASVRSVKLAVETLHDIPGALTIAVERTSGNESQILYRFALRDGAGRTLAEGRATVVLNTPLPP